MLCLATSEKPTPIHRWEYVTNNLPAIPINTHLMYYILISPSDICRIWIFNILLSVMFGFGFCCLREWDKQYGEARKLYLNKKRGKNNVV